MLVSVVNLKVEIVVSQLYQVGVAASYDVAQGNFDELITVYTIFIRIAMLCLLSSRAYAFSPRERDKRWKTAWG